MIVQELRIGNLINYEMTTHIVTGIQISGLVSSKWKNDKDDDEYYHCSVERIEGIILSPEILEKAGFIYDDVFEKWGIYLKRHEYDTDKLTFRESEGFICLDGIKYRTLLPHIKFVHQLQNLHQSLTGTELTINL